MIRRRPSAHIRQLHTKKGVKNIIINKHIHKRYKPKAFINVKDRKLFSHLSNPSTYSTEFGGGLDFDKKGKLEQIHVTKGKKYEINLPEDFEVLYHTHPSKYTDPPSPEDITTLLKSKNQQAELIFKNGEAFTVSKTPKNLALSKLPATKLNNKLGRAFSSYRGKSNEENNWKDYLETLGFSININKNKNKPIGIDITPKEQD